VARTVVSVLALLAAFGAKRSDRLGARMIFGRELGPSLAGRPQSSGCRTEEALHQGGRR
jgi:hypothetical protein